MNRKRYWMVYSPHKSQEMCTSFIANSVGKCIYKVGIYLAKLYNLSHLFIGVSECTSSCTFMAVLPELIKKFFCPSCHMEAMTLDQILAWARVVMKDDMTTGELVIAAAQPVCNDGEWTKWWYRDKTRRCSLPSLQIASASTVFYKVNWYCLHTPLPYWSLDNTNGSWPLLTCASP